jgi:hypothetical protein
MPSTFIAIDFFDFDSILSSVVDGPDPEFNFMTRCGEEMDCRCRVYVCVC